MLQRTATYTVMFTAYRFAMLEMMRFSGVRWAIVIQDLMTQPRSQSLSIIIEGLTQSRSYRAFRVTIKS